MTKLLLTLACIASLAFGGVQSRADDAPPTKPPEAKSAAKLVDPAEAEALILTKKVIVLDVRTPREFAGGHIGGATNLDFHGIDFQKHLEHLDKQQSYLVHCAVGGRSAQACKLMSELDFKSLYDLKGGMKAWEKAGKLVAHDK